MPVSVIDPVPALIVVDLQKGIAQYQTEPPVADVIERSVALANAFRAHGLPVVLVNADGRAPGRTEDPARVTQAAATPLAGGWTDLVDDLDEQPTDLRVTKQTWGAFHATDLHELLQDRGVTQVVVTGVATSAGVESTARAAHEHGYHVVVATDAVADMSPERHHHSLEQIFPCIAERGTTEEIITLLETSR